MGKFINGHVSKNKGKKLPHLSGANASNWKGGKIKKICEHCSKEMMVFKYRKDTARFCSISCLAKHSTGENSKNWGGGITTQNHKHRTSAAYIFWRKECLMRDNFICQKTGVSGGKLHIHHINNFKDFEELRFSVENGITLSEKSHRKFHSIYGNTNNTREQLIEFLNA